MSFFTSLGAPGRAVDYFFSAAVPFNFGAGLSEMLALVETRTLESSFPQKSAAVGFWRWNVGVANSMFHLGSLRCRLCMACTTLAFPAAAGSDSRSTSPPRRACTVRTVSVHLPFFFSSHFSVM
jgi:hypothetical protein